MVRLLVVILLFVLVSSCQAFSPRLVVPQSRVPLVLEEASDDASDFQAKLLAFLDEIGLEEQEHFVLFVHGLLRDQEHFQELVFPKIQKLYPDLKFMLFNWDAAGFLEYPDENARLAARELRMVLLALEQLRKKRNFRFSLFCHSMGNIVLESLVKQFASEFPPLAIENAILDAPDVDLVGHRLWLAELKKFAKRVYVTVNRQDLILGLSQWFNGKKRLGRGEGIKSHLSLFAVYFDVSGKQFNHKYFFAGDQKQQEYLLSYQRYLYPFYQKVLFGDAVDFSDKYFSRYGNNLYQLR